VKEKRGSLGFCCYTKDRVCVYLFAINWQYNFSSSFFGLLSFECQFQQKDFEPSDWGKKTTLLKIDIVSQKLVDYLLCVLSLKVLINIKLSQFKI